jgi:tRNA modification GTPase
MSLPKNANRDKTNLSHGDPRGRSDAVLRCALLTGVGRSAVAVIGVRGTAATLQLAQCFTPATKRPYLTGQIRYGQWNGRESEQAGGQGQTAGEAVVVIPISPDEFEIHAHGGSAAASRIIDDLRGLGVVAVDQRGWIAVSDQPLLLREAEQVLSHCLTAQFAAVAMDQVRGALLDWCRQSLRRIQDHSSIDRVALPEIAAEAGEILQYATFGMRLTGRFHVVLLGQPNVGKSSLVNAIVGYDRSITMDLPGTTRDVLHADTVIGGVPIRLSDTAGIRDSGESIEQQGVQHAQGAAEQADLVLLVSDPQTAAMQCPSEKRTLRVLNKADLINTGDRSDDSVIKTVATTGRGVEALIDAIANSLVSFPAAGTPVPVTQRQVDVLRKLADVAKAGEAAKLLQELIDGVNVSRSHPP